MFYLPKLKITEIIIILISVLFFADGLRAQAENVLVIQSYSPEYPWTKQIQSGITEEVRKVCPEAHIYSEYLDAKRVSSEKYFSEFFEMLKTKYQNVSDVDLIISCDNAAFRLLKKNDETFYPATPLIACGINWNQTNLLENWNRPVRVFTEHPMVIETVEVVQKLFPKRKLAFVCEDNTISGRLSIELFENHRPEFPEGIEIEYFTNGTFKQICGKLRKKRDQYAILLMNYQRDDQGRYYDTKSLVQIISKLNMPVFVLNYTYMEGAVIGGYPTEPFQEGAIAGEFAGRVLNGKAALAGQSVVDKPHNRLHINLDNLQKFGKDCQPIKNLNPVISKKPLTAESLINIIGWYSLITVLLIVIIAILAINFTKRRKAEKKLHSANRYLDTLVRNVPGAIIRCDKDFRCIDYNEYAAELLGFSKKEKLKGRDFCDVTAAINLTDAFDSIKRAIDSDKEFREIFQFPGSSRYYDIRVTQLSSENSAQNEILCFIYDISREVKMRLEIEEKKQELERSNSDLEQFAYIASHDLQEPVRMVTCYLDLLESEMESSNQEIWKYIKYAKDGSERINSLIKDLLSYSRAGSNEYEFKAWNLSEVAEESKNSLKPRIDELEAKVKIEQLPMVRCDRTQMYRLFTNLLSNALKYHKKDTAPEVFVSSEMKDNYWQINVADNGLGISEEYRNKIFETFKRLNSRSEYEGTGIGLAICKKIVQKHSGNIWVEPNDRGGSTFCFTIPII
ncbi:Phytochrome-like protein cph1 [Sedimentisphaera cyanobacteriorum]|uniref:histidine kinase n=1 Tax=Sedimentisphaera cyanobacteriorum TaxID=1940790 RepID=A0A1Q2HSF2_9BACT|nr:ATP-binding protein [Sedimentisphaera cyanobacteriorum]AQQ10372.1 Phytochrome-like protein cph1 [Sedimentisphaera cyanobacteriorum]